jgi:predicted MFS family arabinose efflux permease
VGPAVGIWLSQSAGYPAAFAAAFALTASSLLLRLARRRPLLLADLRRRVVRARSAPRAEPPSSRAPGSRLSRLVEIGSVRPAAVVFLYTFASAAVNTFLAAYALSRGIAQAGLFFTAMGIALGAGRFVIGRLHARFGERWTVVSAIACTVVSMLLITWAANLALLLVAGALFGWGLGLLQPAMTARVISATPAERHGLANSTVFLGVDLGFAVGGLALSAVAGIAGLPWVFLSAALLVGLSLVYYLRISRRAGR